jgi:ligand-binding sensor domain-containing protein/two-component sensor histidine kinase
MKSLLLIFAFSLITHVAFTQQAFTHISTDDGMGLSSNVITSLYQDKKGFIWVGTANGLQRFDGSKFVQLFSMEKGSDAMPYVSVSQIIPLDSNRLLVAFESIREFGIFNTSKFTYKKVEIKKSKEIHPRAEYRLWKTSDGEIFLNIVRYGTLHFIKNQNAFVEDDAFPLPKPWHTTLFGCFEDEVKQQYWFSCVSGLCVYDKASKQLWHKNNNPNNIGILNNTKIQDNVTELYIDKQRRFWVFAWPGENGGGQVKFCVDSNGNFLNKDTTGLNKGLTGYAEFRQFYETKKGAFWIYGMRALFNYSPTTKSFSYIKSNLGTDNIGINYEAIFQIMEDRDGSIWLATDRGLYFTTEANSTFSVVNILFDNSKSTTSITDIMEMPNGDFWFASWGQGIKSLDKNFNVVPNYVLSQKPKKDSAGYMAGASILPWCMQRQSSTGNIFIGCNGGVLLEHNPTKRTTEYLRPKEFNFSTIRYITEDKYGKLWFGTQGGRLIKYSNNQFTVMQDIGSIIYKVFIDKEGWLWLATHEKGFYAINPIDGKILQHYVAGKGPSNLNTNTANDIEQLNDSIIVVGAGALNFVNKKRQTVRLMKYEDGLPSNTVSRLRMDANGYLWLITANGLSRYNPNNNRITTYGKKDGVFSAEQTNVADYLCSEGFLMFGGSNSLLAFHPSVFANTQPPPDVTLIDFKLFNQYLPVDSLLSSGTIKLKNDQNSFSLYYGSLSFMQYDKLSYYYKMEGVDKDWIKADKSFYINYALLPSGKYTLKMYAENIEGMRSNVTEIRIHIKPPFWRTWWFLSTLLFAVALIIYAVHNMRVNRILAVEKVRTRVARDLHDDMGSTLSTINILSAMAKSKMNTDAVRTTEYLAKISDNSQRMMEAMDDIVWSIKPSNDSMQKITARMREFATNVLEAKEMDMKFKIGEDVLDIKLNMEARRDFFLIFKEAVNNAAKYSKAEKVSIDVHTQKNRLMLCVKDNGKGFNANNADNGNGIGNMKKRADNMNGRIELRSEEGKGTTIKLSVPLDKQD